MQKKKWYSNDMIRYANLLERHGRLTDTIRLLSTPEMSELPGTVTAVRELRMELVEMEVPQARTLKTEDLYAADEDCYHISNPWNWSGVKCMMCTGWYCA